MKHIFLNVEPMMKFINRKNPSILRTSAGRQAGLTLDEGEQLKNLDKEMGKILEILRKRGWYIGVMESCTGGAIANAITNIPGASDVFRCGLVTYCNEAKIKAGVDEEIIEKYGVYSVETAEEMARKIEGQIGVGVTGNLPGKVWVAVRIENKILSKKVSFAKATEHLDMNSKIEARKEMKNQIVEKVVEMISDNL